MRRILRRLKPGWPVAALDPASLDWLWLLAAAVCLVFFGKALAALAAQGLILAVPWQGIFSGGTLVHFGRQSFVLCVFWLSAHLIGKLTLRLLGLQRHAGMDWIWALGLGSGVMALLPLPFSLIGLPRPWAWRDAACVLAAVDLAMIAPKLKGARIRARSLDPLIAAPCVVAGLSGVFAMLRALTPVTFFDSLIYHIALPDLYLRRGAIVAVPMNPFAGIPANASMLYLWLLTLGDGVSCQLMSWSCGMLTAVLLIRIGRRLGQPRSGWWAAALLLTTPMAAMAAFRPGAEMVWSFYLALALEGLLCAPKDPGILPAAGLAAGLALGTKYQAIFLVPAAALLLSRRWGGPGWRRSAGFWLAASAVAAPWLAKNIIHYHNPIYPFLNGTLFPRAWDIDWTSLLGGSHARTPWGVLGSLAGLKEHLSWLFRLSWPYPRNERDCLMSLLYWLLLPRLLWDQTARPARRCLAVAAIMGIPLSLSTTIMRYQIPTLVPLGLAAGALVPEGPELRCWLARLALSAGLALHFLMAYASIDNGLAFAALPGGAAAARFLGVAQPGYPCPPFNSYAWLNCNSAPGAKVLVMGEERTFYLERDREAAGLYAREPLSVYIERSGSADGLYGLLRGLGFTHIYLNAINAWKFRSDPYLDGRQRAMLQGFWKRHLKEVFRDKPEGFSYDRFGIVYKIVDQPAGPGPEFPF